MGKRPLRNDQIMYYAVQSLNIAYTAYRLGDMELVEQILGMCSDCAEGFFRELGVQDKADHWEFDIDEYNRAFAFIADDEEDEEEEEFDMNFWITSFNDTPNA